MIKDYVEIKIDHEMIMLHNIKELIHTHAHTHIHSHI